MGIFSNLFSKQQEHAAASRPEVTCPVAGTVVKLESVSDPMFANKAMGDGIAIEPSEGVLVAPVTGTVQALFPTGHAVAVQGDNGISVLLHIDGAVGVHEQDVTRRLVHLEVQVGALAGALAHAREDGRPDTKAIYQHEFLAWLRDAGFSVNPNVARCNTPAEVHEFCAEALAHPPLDRAGQHEQGLGDDGGQHEGAGESYAATVSDGDEERPSSAFRSGSRSCSSWPSRSATSRASFPHPARFRTCSPTPPAISAACCCPPSPWPGRRTRWRRPRAGRRASAEWRRRWA